MALFTSKADSDIPLLTQLYQLEESEILPWLDLWNQKHSYAPVTTGEGTKAILSEFLSLLRLVMDAMVSGKHPTGQVKHDLNAWLENYLTPPIVFWEITDTEGLTTPLERSSAVDTLETGPPRVTHGVASPNSVAAFCSRVLTELLWIITHGKLSRCEECQKVYQVTNRRQRFCSDRCADRSRLQKFRKKKRLQRL